MLVISFRQGRPYTGTTCDVAMNGWSSGGIILRPGRVIARHFFDIASAYLIDRHAESNSRPDFDVAGQVLKTSAAEFQMTRRNFETKNEPNEEFELRIGDVIFRNEDAGRLLDVLPS